MRKRRGQIDMERDYDIDFRDYSFNDRPGIYLYRLQKKLMNKSGRMSIFVEGRNGEKHQITLFPDSGFLGMESVQEGAVIAVEFVCSRNGKVYAKRISVQGSWQGSDENA